MADVDNKNHIKDEPSSDKDEEEDNLAVVTREEVTDMFEKNRLPQLLQQLQAEASLDTKLKIVHAIAESCHHYSLVLRRPDLVPEMFYRNTKTNRLGVWTVEYIPRLLGGDNALRAMMGIDTTEEPKKPK